MLLYRMMVRDKPYRLEAMNLNVFLLADSTLNEELGDLLTMIALELNNVQTAVLLLDNAAITGKVLLEDLEDLLGIDVLGESFNSCQGLASIPLMQTDIYRR